MASKKPSDGGVVNRLAGRGEEAVTRLVEELGKNPRVTDALSRVMDAKTRIDQSARGAVAQAGLAAADELKELRKQIERLERRLAKLESTDKSAAKPAAKRTTAKKAETKKAPTAKKRTTVKKDAETAPDAEKAPSPSPGRSIGGGTGRGSSAS
jgi:polyhydroxyalkanoate synthesis regulator phasin